MPIRMTPSKIGFPLFGHLRRGLIAVGVFAAVAEAEALYVRQLRLPERLRRSSGEFVIWDVGLGAAANVLTVLRARGRSTEAIVEHRFQVEFQGSVSPVSESNIRLIRDDSGDGYSSVE
jgi:tRNA U34 5-methylaminomethyl-2-thiouridine-forming methyltransferase MnmC